MSNDAAPMWRTGRTFTKAEARASVNSHWIAIRQKTEAERMVAVAAHRGETLTLDEALLNVRALEALRGEGE